MWSQYNFVYLLSSFLWCSSGTLAACYPLSIKNQQQPIKNTLTLFLNTKWMIKCNFSWILKKGRKHLLISGLKNAFVTVEMVCNFYTCIQSDEESEWNRTESNFLKVELTHQGNPDGCRIFPACIRPNWTWTGLGKLRMINSLHGGLWPELKQHNFVEKSQ